MPEFKDLSPSGLLWLINKTVFHPRGFALGLHKDKEGEITGWTLMGDGTEPWSFTEEIDKEYFQKAEETLAILRASSTPQAPSTPTHP